MISITLTEDRHEPATNRTRLHAAMALVLPLIATIAGIVGAAPARSQSLYLIPPVSGGFSTTVGSTACQFWQAESGSPPLNGLLTIPGGLGWDMGLGSALVSGPGNPMPTINTGSPAASGAVASTGVIEARPDANGVYNEAALIINSGVAYVAAAVNVEPMCPVIVGDTELGSAVSGNSGNLPPPVRPVMMAWPVYVSGGDASYPLDVGGNPYGAIVPTDPNPSGLSQSITTATDSGTNDSMYLTSTTAGTRSRVVSPYVSILDAAVVVNDYTIYANAAWIQNDNGQYNNEPEVYGSAGIGGFGANPQMGNVNAFVPCMSVATLSDVNVTGT